MVFRSFLDDVVSLESIIVVGAPKCDDDVANTIQLSSKEENSKPYLFWRAVQIEPQIFKSKTKNTHILSHINERRMPQKSYDVQEVEQKLIQQIRNEPILSSMMSEHDTPPTSGNSTKSSSLYMDEIELGGDYKKSSTPAPTVADLEAFLREKMNGKSKGELDDAKSNKHGRFYRNITGPILMFAIGVVLLAVMIGVVIVTTASDSKEPHMNKVETREPHLSSPVVSDLPALDFEDFVQQQDEAAEAAAPEKKPHMNFDEKICVPKIDFHDEFFPDHLPRVASDGEKIVVKHGEKLKFYQPDHSHTYAMLDLPHTHSITHTRSSSNGSSSSEDPADYTLAIDGDTSVMGDYLHNEETGVVYIMRDNGDGATTTQVINVPDGFKKRGKFGSSVAIHKDRCIIGAPFGHGDTAGAAYLYEQTDEGTWELVNTFPPVDEDGSKEKFELFGENVAIFQDRAAVAGYNEYDEVTVFVYEYNPESDSWEEIDDIIVDKHCQTCQGTAVEVFFREDGSLFISYPRKNEISYLHPSMEETGNYVLAQKIYPDEDSPVDMDQIQVIGGVMVVGVIDSDDVNFVYVYSQSDDDYKWVKVDEIELPSNKHFNPETDYVDLALSKNNLIVNYGDDQLIWYTFDGCQ